MTSFSLVSNHQASSSKELYEQMVEDGIFDPSATYSYDNCYGSLIAESVSHGDLKQLLQKAHLKTISRKIKGLTACAKYQVATHCSRTNYRGQKPCDDAIMMLFVLSNWNEENFLEIFKAAESVKTKN